MQAYSTNGLTGSFSDSIFLIDFQVAAGASGSTKVSVTSTFTDSSVSPPHTYDTEVDDENSNPITLNPAPTNDASDPVFGTVTVSTISQAPTITSSDSATFTAGVAGIFIVTTSGSPTPTLSETGLPSGTGLTFTDNGNGTATLASTAATPAGNYPFTITAHNGAGADDVQNFTLHVSPQSGSQTALSVGNVSAAAGMQITVPINFSDGGNNLPAANPVQTILAVVTYDPSVLTLDPNHISLGSLLSGWIPVFNSNYDNSGNTIVLGAISATGLSGVFSGDAFDLPFTVNPGATGATKVYIRASTADGQYQTSVGLADNSKLTLNPAPTNDASDPVFGTVAFGLSVTALQPTKTGFTATFSQPIEPSALNLYDTQTASLGPADVTLVGASAGAISGSLVVDSGRQSVTFIATAGVLPPDDYTVTFRSATDGFETPSGTLLMGSDVAQATITRRRSRSPPRRPARSRRACPISPADPART